VKPFYQISEIVIEKETTENIFNDVFLMLYHFFSDKREFRTVEDVDKIMKKINDFITRKYPEFKFFNDEEREEQIRIYLESFSHFIDQNEGKINNIFKDEQYHPFLSNWIMNLETSLEAFSESFELFISKKNKIIRSSSRAVDGLFNHLFNLIKAIFLVLYRIVEQIYMISEKISYSHEDEIDYLLNDIVYLENIQRQINSSFK
jgi:hypothetical protein